MLISMANSEVVSDITSQLPLYPPVLPLTIRSKEILSSFDIVLPKDLVVRCWDPVMVVHVFKQMDSALDFQKVFERMDCKSFVITTPTALQFLVKAWKAAGLKGSISSLLQKQWKYQGMQNHESPT